MSLIHERLYSSKNLAHIDFKEYVEELVTDILSLAPAGSPHIEKEIDVERVILDINHAIPCGLIINELISNALRHAFPDGRKGKVEIRMHRNKRGRIFLHVGDNGVGFPEGADLMHTKTLGLQLVLSLVKQLNGTIDLDGRGGTAIKIAF